MNSLHKRSFLYVLILGLMFSILLAGCTAGGMSFSPEQAAIRAVTEPHGSPAVVDQGSVQVHQSVPMGDETFVVISYTQLEGNRKDRCTFVYSTGRLGIGTWVPRGGGGGCTGSMPGQAELPPETLEVGAGTGSNGPNAMHSYVYGLVRPTEKDETIMKVRVTWQDGQVQEVNVINGSYLAVRAGELRFQKIEGLSESGEAIHTVDAPPQMGPR